MAAASTPRTTQGHPSSLLNFKPTQARLAWALDSVPAGLGCIFANKAGGEPVSLDV